MPVAQQHVNQRFPHVFVIPRVRVTNHTIKRKSDQANLIAITLKVLVLICLYIAWPIYNAHYHSALSRSRKNPKIAQVEEAFDQPNNLIYSVWNVCAVDSLFISESSAALRQTDRI